MTRLHELVEEFHNMYNVPVRTQPTLGTPEEQALRLALIKEEVQELEEALAAGDIVEVYDALLDIAWVTSGSFHTFGLPLEPGLEEVARSNRTKLGADGLPVYNEMGKVVKGPNYSPPNLKEVLDDYQSTSSV